MNAAVAFSAYVCEGRPTVGDPTIPPDFFSTEGYYDDDEESMGMSQENPFSPLVISKLQGHAISTITLSTLGSN